jgi:asparagine synthase (glutamine-hydrolysing)
MMKALAGQYGATRDEWVVGAGADWVLEPQSDPTGRLSLFTAGNRDLAVLFDGTLYNRQDLASTLTLSGVPTDAQIVLAAYERWGADLTRHLKGRFGLVVSDSVEKRLLAARDPLGAYPLFHARDSGGRLLLSKAIGSLVQHPSVDRSLNRAALADHLCHRWPYTTETFYNAVHRVPPGCRLVATAAGTRVERYWDPAPPGEPVNWVTEDELETFDQRLETAVDRAMAQGRTGIFLSGGLDSISVAAIATELASRSDRPAPVALSIGFPEGECNEELIQRGVARSLNMPQEFVPFYEAAPARGLLTTVLDYSRRSSAPVLNAWRPVYSDLTLRGRRLGVEVILSGAGGDEWLTVSPYLIADLLRKGDLSGVLHLAAMWRRSFRMSPWAILRGTIFTYGVRPLASLALHRIAPKAWHGNRLRRAQQTTRPWVAPDRHLRQELDARTADALTPVAPAAGFYFHDVRASLDHSLTSMELEEIFEMGRRLDVKFLHPYWDADVVDLLYRTPPALLSRGGRSKGLVRDTVARRFPALGLDRQKKVAGTAFFESVLRAEVPRLWEASRGTPALAALGVVDPARTQAMAEASFAEFDRNALNRIWNLLNLDAWVQSCA